MVHLLESDIHNLRPEVYSNSHKGKYGKLAIFAGSDHFLGAAILTAKAAYRSGVGYVTVFLSKNISWKLPSDILWENVTFSFYDRNAQFEKNLLEYDACVFGPGLDAKESNVHKKVLEFLTHNGIHTVVDATGLLALDLSMDLSHVICTPHPKELSSMIRVSVAEIQKNRKKMALEFTKKWGTNLVLKGAYPILALLDGNYYIGDWDNDTLAVAGTGDVLSGILGAMLARGLDIEKSMKVSVLVHHLAALSFRKEFHAKRGMMPTDLISYLPELFE